MKRILLMLLFFTFVCGVYAYDAEIDGLFYNFNGDEAEVTYKSYYDSRYTTSSKAVVHIPKTIEYNNKNYCVTTIGFRAFFQCKQLKEISIPKTITKIEYEAFAYCTSLSKVVVEDITAWCNISFECNGPSGNWLFANDTNPLYHAKHIYINDTTEVFNLIIPNGVTKIPNSAFVNCKNLSSIFLPPSITSVGKRAFLGCDEVKLLICNSTIPPTTSNSDSFNSLSEQVFLIVPKLSVTEYKESPYWKDFKYINFVFNTAISTQTTISCTCTESFPISNANIVFGGKEYTPIDGIITITGLSPATSHELTYNAKYEDWDFAGTVSVTTKPINFDFSSKAITNSTLKVKGTYDVGDATVMETGFEYNGENRGKGDEVTITGLAPGKEHEITYYVITKEGGKETKTKTFKTQPVVPEFEKEAITNTTIKVKGAANAGDATVTETGFEYNGENRGKGDEVIITGLAPGKEHEIVYYVITVEGGKQTVTKKFKTLPINLSISKKATTNCTLTLRGENNTGDATVTETGFEINGTNKGKGNEVTLRQLTPGNSYFVTYYVVTTEGGKETTSQWFSTNQVFPSASATTTPTSCVLKGSYGNLSDATFDGEGFIDGPESNVWNIYGLDPNTSYTKTYFVKTKEGGTVTKAITFKTAALTFETLPAQACSNTKALISATTNGDDDEARFGFEWRRYDAPDIMPSTLSPCPVYNGVIAGTLNGLSANTYYKYRPYYKSDSGKTYYGDWIAFITADAYVYFEPLVHTFEAQGISATSAVLKGYVIAGSDDITAQGFEYWIVGSAKAKGWNEKTANDVKTVTTTGQRMTVTIDGLKGSSIYHYRAFVTTANGTTYGEEQEFTTPVPTGIENIESSSIQTKSSAISGIYTLQGAKVADDIEWLKELPHGVYIVNGRKMVVK